MNPSSLSSGYDKAAHLYDLFDTKENLEFFLHYARSAGEILDIGAGTGRIAIPIAEAGIKVCCVEPSASMRDELLKKLHAAPSLKQNITLLEGDAQSFRIARRLPAAFLSGVFDHLLDDTQRLSALTNIANHLVPGGKLIFDVFIGLMQPRPLSPAGEVQVGNRLYRRLVASKIMSHEVLETTLIYEISEGGQLRQRIEERSLVGLITRDKLHGLLQAAGYVVEQEFGNYDFREYKQGDSLLVLQASRVPDRDHNMHST
jgi:SAM-dependent methyltransferase